MTKQMVLVVVAGLVGCGNVTDPSSGADDPADAGDVDEPVPVDPAVLSIVPRQIHDERGDAMAFSSGEPVHTHAGPMVEIGGSGCPAIYRYAYLLDRSPAFGRQVTQNALAFEVAAPTAVTLDDSASAYRVVTPEGQVVIGWTTLGAHAADGRYTVALHRDEAALLGSYTGQLHFDVRVRDTAGLEQLATACWEHHPMAAPLAIEAPTYLTGAGTLAGRALGTSAQVVDVIWPYTLRNVEVFGERIVQQTAEPMTLEVKPAAPSGTYSMTVVDTYTPTTTSTLAKDCLSEPAYCDQSPLPALPGLTRAGAITAGTWFTTVTDEATGITLDCPAGLCSIPPRAAGAAPHAYRVTIMARRFTDLWPASVPPNELGIAGRSVVGAMYPGNTQVRCTNLRTHTIGGVVYDTCQAWTEYTELLALDRARLDLAPTEIRVSTGIGAAPVALAPYLPNGTIAAPPVSWDAGDGPM